MKLETESALETKAVAKKLAQFLQAGDVLALFGDLGSGKTCFTQGLAQGLQITRAVTSPTFSIVKEYQADLPLYHFDLYRLAEAEELYEIGYEEYVYGQGVTVIEWAAKADYLLPQERLELHFSQNGEGGRMLTFIPHGLRAEKIVKEMRLCLF